MNSKTINKFSQRMILLTALLIAANVLIFILQEFLFEGGNFTAFFALNVLFFKEHFFWQPLSSMFLHGNFTHLALNMIVLFRFGRILEGFLGRVKFALLYLVGGVFCSLLCALYVLFAFEFWGRNIFLVGASGAICVLMGYYAFWDKSSTKGLIVALILISFLPLLMGVNVAWYGHIFGFFCGYFWAFLRRKR